MVLGRKGSVATKRVMEGVWFSVEWVELPSGARR